MILKTAWFPPKVTGKHLMKEIGKEKPGGPEQQAGTGLGICN